MGEGPKRDLKDRVMPSGEGQKNVPKEKKEVKKRRVVIRRRGAAVQEAAKNRKEALINSKGWESLDVWKRMNGKEYERKTMGDLRLSVSDEEFAERMTEYEKARPSGKMPVRDIMPVYRAFYEADPLKPDTEFARDLRDNIAEKAKELKLTNEQIRFYSSVGSSLVDENGKPNRNGPDKLDRIGVDGWIEIVDQKGVPSSIVPIDVTLNNQKTLKIPGVVAIYHAPYTKRQDLYEQANEYYARLVWDKLKEQLIN